MKRSEQPCINREQSCSFNITDLFQAAKFRLINAVECLRKPENEYISCELRT